MCHGFHSCSSPNELLDEKWFCCDFLAYFVSSDGRICRVCSANDCDQGGESEKSCVPSSGQWRTIYLGGSLLSSTGEHTSHACGRCSWTGSTTQGVWTYQSRPSLSLSRDAFHVAARDGCYVCYRRTVVTHVMCSGSVQTVNESSQRVLEYIGGFLGHFLCILRSYAQVAPRCGLSANCGGVAHSSWFFHVGTARVKLRGALCCSESTGSWTVVLSSSRSVRG